MFHFLPFLQFFFEFSNFQKRGNNISIKKKKRKAMEKERIPIVFLLPLLPRKLHGLGIDHDDEIADIQRMIIHWFMLALNWRRKKRKKRKKTFEGRRRRREK